MATDRARVYVAGAYSADNVLGVLDNIREGVRWSTQVLLAGYAPFSPWTDFHFQLMLRGDEELQVEDYYEFSLAWLRVCDAVFVTPDWEQSKGTRAEIAEAERLGIPVVYDLDDLPEALNRWRRHGGQDGDWLEGVRVPDHL
jgi:hypothetical protein